MKGWGAPLSAEQHYENGIVSSMEYYGIESDSTTNYLAGIGAFDGTTEQIINQKWLALLYQDPYESYAEYRRTGFPVLFQYDGSEVNENDFPQRIAYPQSEINLNRANVTAVGEGINDSKTKLWWAK